VYHSDININALNSSDSYFIYLKHFLHDYNLSILNTTATRVTLHSSTLIDLLFCNTLAKHFIDPKNIVTTSVGFSDHHYIKFSYKKPKVHATPKLIETLQLSTDSINSFHDALQLKLYDFKCNDDSFTSFFDTVNELSKSCLHKKKRRISSKQQPWVNSYYISLSHKRDQYLL
jgi:hypothetical protein